MKVLLRVKKAPRYYILKSQLSLFGGDTHPEKVTVHGKHKTYMATRHKKNAKKAIVDTNLKNRHNKDMVNKFPGWTVDSDADVEDELLKADVVGKPKYTDLGSRGAQIVKLSSGNRAVIKSDRPDIEVAAYILSRDSGLNVVPPTILREYDGEEYSFQQYVKKSKTVSDLKDSEADNSITPAIQAFYYIADHSDQLPWNRLKTKDGRYLSIDNNSSFQDESDEMKLTADYIAYGAVSKMDKPTYDKIHNLWGSKKDVDGKLRPYLSKAQRNEIWLRVAGIINGTGVRDFGAEPLSASDIST